ncbi:MAG: DUF1569 domain-containing protein [Planctomycetota bacterium]
MDRLTLQFASLEEALEYADQLRNQQYQQLGQWNLVQCLGHLRFWLSFPMDGFPAPGFPFNLILPVLRITSGKSMLKSILKDGFKPGSPTVPSTVPDPSGVEIEQAIGDLASTIERFCLFSGEIQPSPLFGAMDKETAMKLQLRHFEHHLGFFKP